MKDLSTLLQIVVLIIVISDIVGNNLFGLFEEKLNLGN